MKTQIIKEAFKARDLPTTDKTVVWNNIIRMAAFAKIELSSLEVMQLRDELMTQK